MTPRNLLHSDQDLPLAAGARRHPRIRVRRHRSRAPGRVAALALLAGARLAAAPADPDPGFGVDGQVTTVTEGRQVEVGAMVLQPDGKILVGGSLGMPSGRDFLLARYLPDGELDPGFGAIVADFGSAHDYVHDIALQADGRIVAVGTARPGGDFCAIARFLPDGSWDPEFSGDGKLLSATSGRTHAGNAVAIQADGRIVVAGYSAGSYGSDFTLMRFLPDGTRDPEFNGDRHLRLDFDGRDDVALAVTIQDDRRIVVAGFSDPDGGGRAGALARLLPDGSLDPSFGDLGQLILQVPVPYDTLRPSEVIVDPEGRTLVSATLKSGSRFRSVIFRLLPQGEPDPSFGSAGMAEADSGTGSVACDAMALAPDGKLVLTGSDRFGVLGERNTVAVTRFLPDGRLDGSFSDDGMHRIGFGNAGIGRAIQVQPDGRLVVAGVASLGSRTLHVARLVGDPPLRAEAAGEARLNPQTGLYEQQVRVENPGTASFAGFDLAIAGLPEGAVVNNASGRRDTDFVIEWRQDVPAGATVTVTIEYLLARRAPPPATEFSVSPLLEPDPHPATGPEGIAIERCLMQSDGSLLLEFRSTPDARYEVRYSEDGVLWKLSPVTIRAAGNRVQWIDRGPPRTDSPPGASPCRFYLVRETPHDP